MLRSEKHISTVVLVLLLGMAPVFLRAAGPREIEPVDPPKTVPTPPATTSVLRVPPTIGPGENGTVMFKIENQSNDTLHLTALPKLPDGWRMLNANMVVEVMPLATKVACMILVPNAQAPAGKHTIAIDLIDEKHGAYLQREVTTMVPENHDVVAVQMDVPAYLSEETGYIRNSILIQNKGNTAETLEVYGILNRRRKRIFLAPGDEYLCQEKSRITSRIGNDVQLGCIIEMLSTGEQIPVITSAKVLGNTLRNDRSDSPSRINIRSIYNYNQNGFVGSNRLSNFVDVTLTKGPNDITSVYGSSQGLWEGSNHRYFSRIGVQRQFLLDDRATTLQLGSLPLPSNFYLRLPNTYYGASLTQYEGGGVTRLAWAQNVQTRPTDTITSISMIERKYTHQNLTLSTRNTAFMTKNRINFLSANTAHYQHGRNRLNISALAYRPESIQSLAGEIFGHMEAGSYSFEGYGFISGKKFTPNHQNTQLTRLSMRHSGKFLVLRNTYNYYGYILPNSYLYRQNYTGNAVLKWSKNWSTGMGLRMIEQGLLGQSSTFSERNISGQLIYENERFSANISGNQMTTLFGGKVIEMNNISGLFRTRLTQKHNFSGQYSLEQYPTFVRNRYRATHDMVLPNRLTWRNTANIVQQPGMIISQFVNTSTNLLIQRGASTIQLGGGMVLNSGAPDAFYINTSINTHLHLPEKENRHNKTIKGVVRGIDGHGVPGVVLHYNGSEIITDRKGRFNIRNVHGNDAQILINGLSLPPSTKPSGGLSQTIECLGQTTTATINLYRTSTLAGSAELKRGGLLTASRPAYQNYLITLVDTDGKKTLRELSEEGTFSISSLEPGPYTCTLSLRPGYHDNWTLSNPNQHIEIQSGIENHIVFTFEENISNVRVQRGIGKKP